MRPGSNLANNQRGATANRVGGRGEPIMYGIDLLVASLQEVKLSYFLYIALHNTYSQYDGIFNMNPFSYRSYM